MTNYELAGFSSFGSAFVTPAAAGSTDVTLIAIAICIVVIVLISFVVIVIAVVVVCRKWSKCRYVPTLHYHSLHMTVS